MRHCSRWPPRDWWWSMIPAARSTCCAPAPMTSRCFETGEWRQGNVHCPVLRTARCTDVVRELSVRLGHPGLSAASSSARPCKSGKITVLNPQARKPPIAWHFFHKTSLPTFLIGRHPRGPARKMNGPPAAHAWRRNRWRSPAGVFVLGRPRELNLMQPFATLVPLLFAEPGALP